MTILILDDITTAIHYLEREIATHDSGPAVELSIDHYAKVQEYADRMAAETLAVVREMRAQLTEAAPMFGQHGPGLITPRIVDNADRSGANRHKITNAVFSRQTHVIFQPPDKKTQTREGYRGGFFLSVPLLAAFVPFNPPIVAQTGPFVSLFGRKLHIWKFVFFPVGLFNEQKTRPRNHGRTRRPRPS